MKAFISKLGFDKFAVANPTSDEEDAAEKSESEDDEPAKTSTSLTPAVKDATQEAEDKKQQVSFREHLFSPKPLSRPMRWHQKKNKMQ